MHPSGTLLRVKIIKGNGLTAAEVDDALKRLGVNPDKPFTINGRTFTVQMGQFTETKPN